MATTVATPRRVIPDLDVRTPERFSRVPTWAGAGGLLVVLIAISAFVRTRYLSGQFWMDEGISVGISSHSLKIGRAHL